MSIFLPTPKPGRVITHNGQSLTITQWAHELGMDRSYLARRLERMSVEIALSLARCPTCHKLVELPCLKCQLEKEVA